MELYALAWLPERPRADLLFVHGLCEHSGRYLGVASHFVSRGYACWLLDLRGHGRSPGFRAHVAHFDEYAADLDALAERAASRDPAGPAFLVGHSMGGLVALRQALRAPSRFAGVIASSPALGTHPASRPTALRVACGRLLARLVPRATQETTLRPRDLSRDPAVVAAYEADPLVSHRVSLSWYFAYLAAQGEMLAAAPVFASPALVMTAGQDRIVDPEAVAAWAARAPAGRVQLARWDGLYHELLNEPERQQVLERMEAWLEAPLSASLSRAPGTGRAAAG